MSMDNKSSEERVFLAPARHVTGEALPAVHARECLLAVQIIHTPDVKDRAEYVVVKDLWQGGARANAHNARN